MKCLSLVNMELHSFRGSVDVKVHPSMAPIVPTVCANMAFVQPTPRHHLAIAITAVDAQHGARDLGFCVIYAIPMIQLTEPVKHNANRSFLVPNAREHVTPNYHTITMTKCVTLCALRVVSATHVVAMEHVKMDFVNVIQTGSTMVEKNVFKRVRELRYVVDMVHANFMVIHPVVYVNEGGMVKTVTCHARGC
jgi:hypothetical protein